MMHPAPTHSRTIAALPPPALIGLAALAALVLGWLGPLALPFRLLTTIIHELSHGLAALLSGGAFLSFVVFPNGEGVAYTAGGLRWLVIPAGYVGAALFGALLIRLGRHPQRSRAVLAVLGSALMLLSLRYGLPGVFSLQVLAGALTVLAGLGLGGLFLFVAIRASAELTLFLLNLVAFWVGLSALGDIGTLFTLTTASSTTLSDAHAMARLTFVPAPFWALLWVLLAGVALGAALWRTWIRPPAAR